MKKLKYLHTLRHLRFRQILYLFRHRLFKYQIKSNKKIFQFTNAVKVINLPLEYISVKGEDLNIFSENVGHFITPNFKNLSSDYLYEFSFNYLDHLNAANLNIEQKIKMLSEYINTKHKSEWHPYTASRRLVNIILFLSQNIDVLVGTVKSEIEKYSSDVYIFIKNNLEFHIDANHLLANYFALSLFENTFRTEDKKYTKKYMNELDSQLVDGFHYERSLGYTISVIYDFLIFNQVQKNINQNLLIKVSEVLKNINNLPKENFDFGDNVYNQVPQLDALMDLARLSLLINTENKENKEKLQISNYYILKNEDSFCVVVDGGAPTPEHQPGHAHDSTGSFTLSYQGQAIVSNGGVSTYEKNRIRNFERSRYSYSKPINLGISQDVWGGFRVAQRRSVKVNAFNSDIISISVNTDQGSWQKEMKIYRDGIVDTYQTVNQSLITQYIISESVDVIEWSEKKLILLETVSASKFRISCVVGKALPVQKLLLGQRYGSRRKATVLRFYNSSEKLSIKIEEI